MLGVVLTALHGGGFSFRAARSSLEGKEDGKETCPGSSRRAPAVPAARRCLEPAFQGQGWGRRRLVHAAQGLKSTWQEFGYHFLLPPPPFLSDIWLFSTHYQIFVKRRGFSFPPFCHVDIKTLFLTPSSPSILHRERGFIPFLYGFHYFKELPSVISALG